MDNDSGVSASKKIRRDLTRESREKEELWSTAREQLVERILRQQQEIDGLLAKQASDSSLDELRESVEKMKMQVAESNRQENQLMKRLAVKEREVQDLLAQISEIKQTMNPSSSQLQSMLLDPAVNLLFIQMKREMDCSRTQLEQSQKDLAAWKFTPDSQTGKRLMAKCRMLLQENEELGRTVSSGRLAKLEGDIALQKRLISEMKNSEKDTEEFLGDVDEDLEAMQSTVYLLQQELKDAKERISSLQQEIDQLREARREPGDRPSTDRKLQIVESPDAATADKRDHKTAAVAESRGKSGGQNCGQVAAADDRHAIAKAVSSSLASCDQTRQSKSSSASDGGRNCERMEVDDGDCDERRNIKQRCLNASRTSSVVGVLQETNAVERGAPLPSADSMAMDDGSLRSTEGTDAYRTAAGKVGSVERDYALANGMDDDSRRAAVTE